MPITTIQLATSSADLSGASTSYFPIFGGVSGGPTTEALTQYKVNDSLTAKNLLFTVSVNANTSITARTRKNGANGAMSVTIGASATGTFEDTVNSDSLVAGDIYNYQIVTQSSSVIFRQFSVTFDHTSSATKVQGWAGSSVLTSGTSQFYGMNGLLASATEASTQFKSEVAFTMSRLAAYISSNSGTTCTIRTRKNGANGAQSLSVGSGSTGYFEQSPLSTTDSVAVGDLICLSGANTGASNLTIVFMAVQEQDAFAGNFHMIASGSDSATSNTFNTPEGSLLSSATESVTTQTKVRGGPFLAKNMFVRVTIAGGAGTNTVTSRKNGANGNLTVSMSTNTGIFEDTTHSDSYSNGDLIDYNILSVSPSSRAYSAMELVSFTADRPQYPRKQKRGSTSLPKGQAGRWRGPLTTPIRQVPPERLLVRQHRGLTPPRIRGGRGKTTFFGKPPRKGVSGTPPKSFRKDNRPYHRPLRGRSRLWGRIPRPGVAAVTTRQVPAMVMRVKLRQRQNLPRGKSRLFGRPPRTGVVGRPPQPIRLHHRQERPPRGKAKVFGRLPRVGLATRQQPPEAIRTRKRGLIPPQTRGGRGRARVFGRTPRIGVVTREQAPEVVRTKKRGLTAPTTRGGRGKTTFFGRIPRTGVVGRPPQPVRLHHRQEMPPRGRLRQFGRTPRIGVVTRETTPEVVRTKKRLTPLPRGRSRRFTPIGRIPPAVTLVKPRPIEVRHRLQSLPRGRRRIIGFNPGRFQPGRPPQPVRLRHKQERPPRGKATRFGRTPRVGVSGTPPKPIREHQRPFVNKTTFAPSKGRSRAWGRTPRVGVTSRRVPPFRVKKRTTPLPRGRSRKIAPKIAFAVAPVLSVIPQRRTIREHRRTLMPPRGKVKVFGTHPGRFQPGHPPLPIRLKHRQERPPKGKLRRFGRTPRIGAITREQAPEVIRTKRRMTPFPRGGRSRKIGWRRPPGIAQPPPRGITSHSRLLKPPKGKVRIFGRTPRIGVTTRSPSQLGITKRARRPTTPKGRAKTRLAHTPTGQVVEVKRKVNLKVPPKAENVKLQSKTENVKLYPKKLKSKLSPNTS